MHHVPFQRGFTGMTLSFFKGSPRSNLGSLSLMGHPTVPVGAPSTSGHLSLPIPGRDLPSPSPALPRASAALPSVSRFLQHLWAAAAGAGAASSRARWQLLVSCPPVNHEPQHPPPGWAAARGSPRDGACTNPLGSLWLRGEGKRPGQRGTSTEGTPP